MVQEGADQAKIWRVRPEWPFLLFLVFVVAAYLGLLLLLVGANVLTVSWSQAGEVLKDPNIQHSIKLTFVTCTATAILSVLVSVPVGYLLSRYRFRGRAFVDTLLDIPILLPPLIVGLRSPNREAKSLSLQAGRPCKLREPREGRVHIHVHVHFRTHVHIRVHVHIHFHIHIFVHYKGPHPQLA